jgi:LPXTG-site transpeptidase (sortase) family protein
MIKHPKIGILGISAIIALVFDVSLAWYVLAGSAVVPPVQASAQITTEVIPEPPNPLIDQSPIPPEIIGKPARLRIPAISVDAVMEDVSVAKDGSMAVPKDPMNAGWYSPGPRPGEVGSAVIAGHVNWYRGATGVFKELKKLAPGEEIQVEDENGKEFTFTVREVRKFDAAADATDIFSSDDGKAHLNIITCDGAWNKSEGQYTERLIVFADRAE